VNITSVLIANRGEIALRIIRACKELGIETVQAYSEGDLDSLPVKLADRKVCIGPARSTDSYLNITAVISAALSQGVDAIHPGYGYLSENAEFARRVREEGLLFIGPDEKAIESMGNKAKAREIAKNAGVPTTPGSSQPVDDYEELERVTKKIGFPIMLKASAGGGGKGMRIVSNENELKSAFENAKVEAKSAFNNDDIYVEKYLTDIRHIEVQVLGDGETIIHLGERDCTIQRRNQKLIEECPSPALSPGLRKDIVETAVRLAKEINYKSVGTVEFILDRRTQEFYFMEMNTRIQVEHPITEMITGIDLVKEQIRIASGKKLILQQKDVESKGHAIECRINAENPEQDFMPSPGKVRFYVPSGGIGVRMDTHLYTGYQVPPYYDSLLGKVITWGMTREEAIQRMDRALNELCIEGLFTTIPFYQKVLKNECFLLGDFNTRFIMDHRMTTLTV
jgi:acetyl-CoA carboxylase, biotin carboxylase subunit